MIELIEELKEQVVIEPEEIEAAETEEDPTPVDFTSVCLRVFFQDLPLLICKTLFRQS